MRAQFFALVLYSVVAAAQSPELAQKSHEAKQLMAAGRFAEAVPIYSELVKAAPGNPGFLLDLGMALHLSGSDRAAIGALEGVLKLQPRALPALAMLGASWLRLGDPAKAISPLQKATTIDPKDKEVRQMLADTLLMVGRYSEAATHLKALAGLDPRDPKSWFGLGRTYEALAQETFTKIPPDSPYSLALAAEARLKQKRFTSAFTLYRDAASKLPTLRAIHAGLSEVYTLTNHPDWAAVERRREGQIPAPACASHPAECNFAASRFQETVAATAGRRDAESLYWKTRAYNELALDAFSHLERLPPSAELFSTLAALERNRGRHAESVKYWREAIQLEPRDPQLRRELATSLYLSGEYAKAEPLLRALLQDDPNSAELNFFLGDTLLNSQRPEDALLYLSMAVRQEPGLLPAHATLGRALMETGKAEDALPHLEKALPVDDDGSIHYQLMRAYQSTGQAAKASAMLKQYQDIKSRQTTDPDVKITAPAP